MKAVSLLSLAVCGAMLVAVGCRKTNFVDKMAFKSAINNYYTGHQDCLWSSPVKFPVQADTSNYEQTKGYDALTDAGFLVRKAAEKKRFLIGSKQVNDYDVSDKGRAAWTPDPSQPGYGNFCFGHREVTSVGTFTTATNPNGVNTATVNYSYDQTGVPDWAKSAETQTAFPNVQAALAGSQTATSTLVQTQNGWQLTKE